MCICIENEMVFLALKDSSKPYEKYNLFERLTKNEEIFLFRLYL